MRLAGRFAFAERSHRQVFTHVGHEALHLYDYQGVWRRQGQTFAIVPGTVALSGQGVPTTYDLSRPGHHWCVHFLSAPAGRGPQMELPVVQALGADAAYVRERILRIAVLVERGDPVSQAAAGAALLELLCFLAGRSPGCGGRRGEAAVDRAATIICERLQDPPSAQALAQAVGLTPNYLAARFRARFGMTIARYRLTRRVAQARALLESTELPVAAVGAQVGLADPHRFNKVFRRIAGCAPSACRTPPRRG